MKTILLAIFGVFILNNIANASGTDSTMKKVHVIISTEFGDIKIHLYDETPLHRDNFLKLAGEGFYDSTLFHRVMKGFMIQGGDPLSKIPSQRGMWGNGGPGYTIPAEILPTTFHKRGALAAARTGDQGNPERRSSGSQFYIVQGNVYNPDQMSQMAAKMRMSPGMQNFSFTPEAIEAYGTVGGAPWLDMQYTVFGEIVEGMDVVDKIAELQAGQSDRASKDIMMKMTVVK